MPAAGSWLLRGRHLSGQPIPSDPDLDKNHARSTPALRLHPAPVANFEARREIMHPAAMAAERIADLEPVVFFDFDRDCAGHGTFARR